MSRLESDLAMATNMWGPLGEDVRARLAAAVESPCEKTWEDAYGIILRFGDAPGLGLGLTLWQAVIQVDPPFSFIKSPVTRWVDDETHENGGYSVPVSGWSRTPDAETLRQAIAYATH